MFVFRLKVSTTVEKGAFWGAKAYNLCFARVFFVDVLLTAKHVYLEQRAT